MNQAFSRFSQAFFGVVAATAVVTAGGTLASIAAGSVPAAMAQDQAPAGGAAPRQRMGQMLMSLNLTDAEKTQIKAIMADVRKQNKDVTDRDQKRANYKAAMAKVETVLTPAQRTELHAKMDAMRQQNQAGKS